MKKYNSGFAPILILLLAVVGIGIGGFIFKDKLIKLVKTNLPQKVSIPLFPSPTPDITANWKTYITTDNKLSFKVPINLDVDQTKNHVIYIGSNIIKDPTSADVLVISYTTDGTTPSVYSGTAAGDRTDDGSITFMGKTIPKVKLVFQGKTTDVYYGGGPGLTSLVKIGQAQFIISTSWGLASKNGMPKSTEDVFDQILSTFKFLGQTTNDTILITDAAKLALTNTKGSTLPQNTALAENSLKIMNNWAFGTIVIPGTNTPEAHYFLAQKINGNWQAVIEYTQTFKDWLKITPNGLVNADLMKVLQ